jgi:hypothetical protein
VPPPARPPVLPPSNGCLGLRRKEGPRIFTWHGRIGPSLSRLGFPSDSGEAVALSSLWNKSFRHRLRLGGVSSDADEMPVKEEFAGSRVLTDVGFCQDLDDSWSRGSGYLTLQPGMAVVWWCGTERWLVDLWSCGVWACSPSWLLSSNLCRSRI